MTDFSKNISVSHDSTLDEIAARGIVHFEGSFDANTEPLEILERKNISNSNNIIQSSSPTLANDDNDDLVAKIDMPFGWKNDWEILLLVDVREKENLTIQSHLLDLGIPCETAQLG